jgi:uncharacterized protein
MIRLFSALVFAVSILIDVAAAASLTVVGKGVITVSPDTANVVFRIEARNNDATKAKEQCERTNNKLFAELIAIGIKEAAIRKSFFDVRRNQDNSGKFSGYNVDNSIEVKVTDFQLLPKVIAAGVASDVSRIGQPSYSLSDETSQTEQARLQAYESAKSEAEKSAKALGMKLGPVTKVSVGAAAFSNLFAGEFPIGGGMSRKADFDIQTEIEPIKVEYYVTVEYDLVD